MKNVCLLAFLLGVYPMMLSQTRIETNGSPDFTFHNTNVLNTGVTSRMFFKAGSYYGGGIAMTGTSSTTARLSLFTNTSTDRNNLIERVSILHNGYVGIANAIPQYPLHLKNNGIGFTQESGSGEAKIGFFTSGTAAYIQTHNNIPMYFATNNGSPQMTLTTTGRLGIGTTTPVSKLEVRGKTTIIQQSGEDVALEVNGTIKASGTYPAAFVVTAEDANYAVIDHPAADGNPNAIILVTPRDSYDNPGYKGSLVVYYNTVSGQWTIEPCGLKLQGFYTDQPIKHCDNTCWTYASIPWGSDNTFEDGMQFNVLVIDK